MLDNVLAPVVVANNNGLPIALSIKGVARSSEFFAQFHVVIDLAVEGEGIALGIVLGAPAQRLVGVFQVDDG